MAYDTKKYDDLYNAYANAQDKAASQQKAQAEQDANSRLREAYVSRMQNERKLNDNLTRAGIRGGTTETSNLALQTNYENSRANIMSNRQKAIQEIDTNAEQNKLAYKQQNDAAKLSYIEQREAEDRENALQKQKETEAVKVDFWTAKYGGYYDTKKLKKLYSKAKTTQEKAIIKARINYLTKHKKGY